MILLFLGLQGTCLALAPLYRYFNPSVVDHFYTTNFNELGGGGHGYNYEGIQSFIYPYPVKGSVPLYRYWQPQVSDHFYTTNPNEIGTTNPAHGYQSEGIAGYCMPYRASGTAPLYRYVNDVAHDHFYTTNPNEVSGLNPQGYRPEGITCYVPIH